MRWGRGLCFSLEPVSSHSRVCVCVSENMWMSSLFVLFVVFVSSSSSPPLTLTLPLPHTLTLTLTLGLLSSCVSAATGRRHHRVLRRGSRAGGSGRHVLQQLLPLPAVRAGAGPERRRRPVGAERAAGVGALRRRHTGALIGREVPTRRKERGFLKVKVNGRR